MAKWFDFKRKLDAAERKIYHKMFTTVEKALEVLDDERCEVLEEVIYSQPQQSGYVRTGMLRKNRTKETTSEPKVIIGILRENMEYAEPVEIKPQARGGRPHLIPALERSKSEIRKLFKNLRI